jgi:multiple sugar transport system substrate-binding protein
MRLSKRLVYVLIAMLASAPFAFASATADTASKSALADIDPTGATIVYWHQHSREREEALNKMIAEFNSTNPYKITVKAEYSGNYSQIYNKMIAAIAGGAKPDLVVAYQNQSAGYQVSNALTDLNPYVTDKKWGLGEDIKDFFEGFINQDVNAQFGNQRLGFPPNRSMEVIYYNKTWLGENGMAEPPATWDAFLDASRKATDKAKGTYGYAISTDASSIFAQIISRGGQIAKADGSGYSYNTPATKAAMDFQKKLYDAGYSRKIGEQYGDQTDFGNRKVMFTMSSTSGLPFYDRAVAAGKNGKFDWSVAAIPHTTAKPVENIYGASISVPKSTPQKQLAAWLFIKWMSEPKQQAKWVEVSGYFPVRNSTMASLADYTAKNPKFGDAFKLLQTSTLLAEPPFAGYDLVRDAVTGALNAILDGADIDKTLADLDTKANKIHKDAKP